MVGTSVRDQKVGSQHRKHNRHGQRREQIPGGSGEQQNGDEHDANGQRGDEGRHCNLLRAVQNRVDQVLPPDAHVAMHVLDFHGGVVDQDADCQRHAPERHYVDRLSQYT